MISFPHAGQLFMVGLAGKGVDDSTLDLITVLGINNFIIFRRNVESPEQLGQLCGELQNHCRQAGLPPALISIDQEGGSVARLPPPFTQFADARCLAEGPEPEKALDHYIAACVHELPSAGINMNLAPVLDVCPTGQGFFMEKRVLGDEPKRVAELGTQVIRGLQQGGIAACGKHFPGLGAAQLDPHLHLPVVSRPLAQIRTIDLPPFEAAIEAGLAAIMTSHTIYTELDPHIPATLSEKVLSGLLRDELGFAGVIVTDDLEMGAIENKGSVADAALLAFRAGADLLLICHDHDKIRRAHARLIAAIAAGEVSLARCHQSLERITSLRRRFAGRF